MLNSQLALKAALKEISEDRLIGLEGRIDNFLQRIELQKDFHKAKPVNLKDKMIRSNRMSKPINTVLSKDGSQLPPINKAPFGLSVQKLKRFHLEV